MNLLQVQDALKNASDQQLMGLMQSPDSTAPSYLVLSEIRRRKDMRNKQAPEGQSNRTVADDLLAQDDGGIRDIVAHDEPEAQDGADEMAAGGLASLRRYREGGVVRMQAGGASPITSLAPSGDEFGPIEYSFASGSQDPVIFGRPLHTYSLEELQRLRADERAGVNLLTGPQSNRPALPMAAIESRIAALRGRNQPRFQEAPALSENAPSFEDMGARELANRTYESFASSLPVFAGEEGGLPPAERPTPTTTTTTQPGGQEQPPPGQRPAAQPPAAQPPAARPPARPAANQPAPPAAVTAAPGLDGLRNAAQGTEPSQSSVQFTDRLSPLFARMQEGRVDPSARRNEALNMALIEAGLRIASSRNPSLAGAIGEGAAPAVQSYGQQLSQIRQDQRQDLRDELQGALAQNQNDYYRGRLSQQEFATRQQLIIERIRQDREDARTGVREAGATARNEATIAGANRSPEAQRLWQFMFPGQTFDPNNANHMEGMNRILGRGRDPDQAMDIARLRNDAAVEQRLANAYLRDPEITSLSRRLESVATLPGAEGDRMRAMLRQQLDAARGRVRQELAATSSASPATPPLSTGADGSVNYNRPASR